MALTPKSWLPSHIERFIHDYAARHATLSLQEIDQEAQRLIDDDRERHMGGLIADGQFQQPNGAHLFIPSNCVQSKL